MIEKTERERERERERKMGEEGKRQRIDFKGKTNG